MCLLNSPVLFHRVSFPIQEFIPLCMLLLKLIVVDKILLKQMWLSKWLLNFDRMKCSGAAKLASEVQELLSNYYSGCDSFTSKHLGWPFLLFIYRCGSLWLSVAFCGWAVQPWFSNTCCFSGSWLLHLWTNCFISVWTHVRFWMKFNVAERIFFKPLFWLSIRSGQLSPLWGYYIIIS